uniref:APC regulator of WNT signaling pathway 2 n=1 Tax=Amphiprion percula TaxID=161767 RepID=A0A3P8RMZ5_AMPPE
MANAVASYDQLAHQVEALRKENSHLRRELEDNSNHLSKLETETFGMKEVLKQLQSKLEQEAGTLASSGRSDVLHQLKELHMDLTNYYELKHQPHNLRLLTGGLGGAALAGVAGAGSGEVSFPGPNRVFVSDCRNLLLGQIDREERERCWYFSQLEALSQRLAQLPRIDTFSLQMDLIRQQLEFEAQQVQSVMEERFGTSDEMVQRTQMRVARLEQLEKELQEARGSQESQWKCITLLTVRPPQVEMVFWLLSMLANRDKEEMSRTLLALSSSQDSCIAMRKSGCVPLLVQILHEAPGGGGGETATGSAVTGCSREAKSRASAALHNIIYSQQDEGQARREMRVLHMLEQIRTYCDSGWDWIESHAGTPSPGGTKTTDIPEPVDPQICQAMCAIMKLSFEEEYRRAMNELGGLQVVADLIHLDQDMYGMQNDPINMALRRYAGMALTNLTFGDVVNKATLCSKKSCLQALVAQLASDSEELHQVVSSILRNLSWRADISSKRVLRDIGCVSALMTCALQATKESTLKSLLSALWNMSAHSIDNKVAICSVDGALGFLVSTLTYRCQTNSLAIIESGGGILRNVSSLVATREDYRQILRDHNCLQTLLQHLRSHSLTIVSNACGTLWNLSARSPKDQELLWDLGAVSMLRNLIHSKHKMIAMGSAAALRNLLTNRPLKYKDAAVVSPGSCMPSLYMRKQKALEAELDAKHLAETFDTLEKQSPKHLTLNKPLRHIESLAKDYASDSGCFDDDEAPNVSSSLDTGSFSMLSMFLTNSNFLQNQPRKRDSEPERDVDPPHMVDKRHAPPDDVVSAAAEKLAKKITNTVAKIDRLVEDITMHTSSEDSLSLSSEDHLADWPYGLDEFNEARAKSCSPCRLSDTSSLAHRERLNRAHALLRLKTAHSSVSTDSLNSGSTSDGYCGSKDQMRPAPRALMIDSVDNKDLNMTSIKLSPSYQQVPLIQSVAKFGVAKTAINVQAAQAMRRQAWVPTVMTGGSITKFSPMTSTRSPTIGTMETVQKYSVENTPICFSRCSSLSSLSSGDGALDGQSENELERASPAILEDRSPSSSSENYIHETPLVMSRCSSVSSLGSFESPSIASSIQSDPCSEMIDGTISPSDLPDSPGQTMPPSRSKTPCCVESNGPETQSTGIAGQWESSLRKFMEIADSKERFNLPPDLDTMIYFTVEKPTENFSCASSLSALPLHEHYIQKDVELKLTPLLQQNDKSIPFPDEDEQGIDNGERYSEGNSDDDIEILKECINSAMPSKFRKVRPSLMTTIPPHILNFKFDDSSFTDSAEGTPVNFSSTTSLSDETLQYPVKERGAKDCTAKGMNKQELIDDEAKRIEDLRIFSHFHKPNRMNYPPEIQMSRTTKHVIPTQRVLMQSKEVADRVANQKNRDQSPQQKRRQCPVRKLELPVIKQNTESNLNMGSQKGIFRQLTRSSEDSNGFYEDENEEGTKRTSRKQIKEASRNTLSRSMTNIGWIDNSQAKARGFHRIKQNLIKDESLACYSLSSSLSSLSDAEFDDHKSKAQQIWYKNRHNKSLNMVQQTKPVTIHCQYEEQSSPSSVSMDSEDDLLQKCITSAMPKQRRKMAARKKKENTQKQKQKVSDGWDMDEEMDSDDMAWDKDSDLNSVEWRAIQEGANCVVTGLQASKSQEPSSEETESVLSFMSTSSFTPKERKFAKDKKANKPLDFAQRKPVPNLPVVFRGRTVIYTPKKETAPSQRPPPRKVPTKTDTPKNPNLAQHRSKSLHRLGHPQDTELSLPKRSSTPPPRIPKSSSSGSSQSSTPSKQSQKKITSPTQTNKSIQKKSTTPASSPPASSPPERKGRSPVVNQNEKSPPPKTQKSPVRIPFMQNSVRQPRPLSPLVTNQTTRQPNQANGKRVVPANRFDLVRMTSVHSSGGESDRSGFLRQLTFIKESKTVLRRDGAARNTPGSQNGSPRRAVPGASAVFLCSSRCQELKAAVQTPRRVQVKDPASAQDLSARRPSRRTSSESPCRVAQRNGPGRVSGVRQQQDKDTFKRHASSPSINILSRVTSRSSLRSSSSDSSGRAKSEDDTKKRGQRSASRLNDGVTWRRIRDEDVPQILKSTLPANALPLVPSPDGEKPKLPALPGKLPTILLASRKTSDATVQTEDFPNNKTNSSTSPTVDATTVISEDVARLALLRKISATSGSNLQDGDSEGSLKSAVSTGTSDSFVGGVVTFRQGSPSKAARVTPFNYTPSPMACCLQDTQCQAAPISEKSGGKGES